MCLFFLGGWVTTDAQILKQTRNIESLKTLPSKTSNSILDSVFLPEHFPKQTHIYFKSDVPMLTLLGPPRYRIAGKCGVLSLLSSEEPLAGHRWIFLEENGKKHRNTGSFVHFCWGMNDSW